MGSDSYTHSRTQTDTIVAYASLGSKLQKLLGLHFQDLGHSVSLYGATLSRSITCSSFFPAGKLAYKWACLSKLPLNRFTHGTVYKPFGKEIYPGNVIG